MSTQPVTITGPRPAAAPHAASIWFVGCGNMAGAMVEGWRAAGVDLSRSVAIRPSGTPVPGLRTVRTLEEAGPPPEIMLLGFKPQMLGVLSPGLNEWMGARTVVVSILAGVEAATLRRQFPGAKAIVRAMPNVASSVRRGVTGLFSPDADPDLRARLAQLFTQLGVVIECPDEGKLAAIGAVSGAGPAYVARFIGALAAAGEARGLDPAVALTIARETVFGTGWLAVGSGATMDEIVARVKSPNGTTEAGLGVLEQDIGPLVQRTIDAAASRGAELAAAARAIDSPGGRA